VRLDEKTFVVGFRCVNSESIGVIEGAGIECGGHL
jgi:hypothetical protein